MSNNPDQTLQIRCPICKRRYFDVHEIEGSMTFRIICDGKKRNQNGKRCKASFTAVVDNKGMTVISISTERSCEDIECETLVASWVMQAEKESLLDD